MINKFLILMLLLIFTSCKNNDSKIVDYNYNRKAEIVKLNFSLSENELIDFVQNQTKIDLCDDRFRIGEFNWKSKIYRFPVVFFKKCPNPPMIHNTISVAMNHNNDILVEEKIVNNNQNLKKVVLEESKERLKHKKYRSLTYRFEWNTKLDKSLIKENLINTLEGMKLVLNYQSLQLMGKSLNNLNQKEIEILKEKFSVFILIDNYDFSSPPPRPSIEMKIE